MGGGGWGGGGCTAPAMRTLGATGRGGGGLEGMGGCVVCGGVPIPSVGLPPPPSPRPPFFGVTFGALGFIFLSVFRVWAESSGFSAKRGRRRGGAPPHHPFVFVGLVWFVPLSFPPSPFPTPPFNVVVLPFICHKKNPQKRNIKLRRPPPLPRSGQHSAAPPPNALRAPPPHL